VESLIQSMPPELVGFLLTLALSFLIGLEREGHTQSGLGGVRTFPIIGLGGFLLVEVFPGSTLPFALGLVVLGLLIALSHWSEISEGEAGITTETAALLTFSLGAAASKEMYWLTIAAGVVAVILLQEKSRLEALAVRFPREELRTLVTFLVLTGVILPAVPNQRFTVFEINPFTIWLVVVAVSTISYCSYLLQLKWGRGRGLMLAGVLGGAYSSTATTVVLARKSRTGHHTVRGYVGAIVAATGVMYLKVWILVAIFAPPLGRELTVLFWGLGLLALAAAAILGRPRPNDGADDDNDAQQVGNPLEITTAFSFAALFTVLMIATRIVAGRFGGAGVLAMAAVMGAAYVDPFVLGLTQYAGSGLDYDTAALAVVIATAANNLMKGVYAHFFGSRAVGRRSLVLLAALGALSLGLFLLF
jgi:uncharacterized membrane protein (DUF4010 family)